MAGSQGAWIPIAAEQTSTGYQVAWEYPGATPYFTVWTTDSNGNFLSRTDVAAATSATLQSLQPSLTVAGNHYDLVDSNGSSHMLSSGGKSVSVGSQGLWIPIAVEKTATGYDIAWEYPGATPYFTVWSTDSNGNFLSRTNVTLGTSAALQSLEASFHQLNGDGVIVGPRTATIEAFGSTSLVQVGNSFYLDSISSGSGPALKYAGNLVLTGSQGAWTPVAAEQTSTGYEVAWEYSAAGQNYFTVWNTDNSGNRLSNTNVVLGTSAAFEALEPSFHQDLNGDGVIGVPGASSGNLVVGAGQTLELTSAFSGTITFAGATGTLKIDNSASFSGIIGGQLAIGDVIDFADMTAGSAATIGYSGNNSAGTLTVSDGTHTASLALLGNYSLANFTASSDGQGGTSVVDPPLPAGQSGNLPSENSGAGPLDSDAALNQHLALWSQYMASAFPSSGWGGAGVSTGNTPEFGSGLSQLATPVANQQHA